MSFKHLYVYPEDSSEVADVRVFLVTQGTDVKELQTLIHLELGIHTDESSSLQYFNKTYDRWIVLPFSSLIPHLFSGPNCLDTEIAVRLRPYSTRSNEIAGEYDRNVDSDGGDWENDKYFGEYARIHIHWHMLKDKKRCEAYRKAIMDNSDLFKDKVVLDVGCGTGILSVFAAQAGAKKVYAIEASNMYTYAEKVVRKNGFATTVEVIHGRIESVELPVEQVDIIISEWMGVFLIYESMFDSVLWARDQYLAPDGHLFPSKATMYIAPMRFDSWWNGRMDVFKDQISGVDVSSLYEYAKTDFTGAPLKGYEHLDASNVLCEGQMIKTFDTKHISLDELRSSVGKFHFTSEELKGKEKMHGFVVWFDVEFEYGGPKVVLSTTPFEEKTHWYQDLFFYDHEIALSDDSELVGTAHVLQHDYWRRHCEMTVEFRLRTGEKWQNMSKHYVL